MDKSHNTNIEHIDGQRISQLRTLGSKYDAGYILEAILDTGEVCRISTAELLKIVGEYYWEIKMAKTYRHLKEPIHYADHLFKKERERI